MNCLLLGGTTEASAIARGLAGMPGLRAVLSLAGRTRAPLLPAIECRVGGFGGAAGLTAYLRTEKIDLLVDATHPFAVRISANARIAARQADVARLMVVRPAWVPGPGDRWQEVKDMPAAAVALGMYRRRVFLTVGQQELAPFADVAWHDYLLRSVDAPDPTALPEGARCIAARGPFTEADELRLLWDERIEVLVTKNSGGTATAAKLAAARRLGVPVVMVRRPPSVCAGDSVVANAEAALDWVRRHAGIADRRGV